MTEQFPSEWGERRRRREEERQRQLAEQASAPADSDGGTPRSNGAPSNGAVSNGARSAGAATSRRDLRRRASDDGPAEPPSVPAGPNGDGRGVSWSSTARRSDAPTTRTARVNVPTRAPSSAPAPTGRTEQPVLSRRQLREATGERPQVGITPPPGTGAVRKLGPDGRLTPVEPADGATDLPSAKQRSQALRVQAERARAEREQVAQERVRAAQLRAARERVERERTEQTRAQEERVARSVQERAELARRAEAERAAREQAARVEAERLERERAELATREQAERERAALEQAALERAERARAAQAEQSARERAERAAQARAEQAEREEAERAEREEAERAEREERERVAHAEAERVAQERASRKKVEREREGQARERGAAARRMVSRPQVALDVEPHVPIPVGTVSAERPAEAVVDEAVLQAARERLAELRAARVARESAARERILAAERNHPTAEDAHPDAPPVSRFGADVEDVPVVPLWPALPELGTDTGSAVHTPVVTRRGFGDEAELAADADAEHDDDQPPRPYSWLHWVALIAVAFVLGMLIVMVITRDAGAVTSGGVAPVAAVLGMAPGAV